jgi:hypothetical protein
MSTPARCQLLRAEFGQVSCVDRDRVGEGDRVGIGRSSRRRPVGVARHGPAVPPARAAAPIATAPLVRAAALVEPAAAVPAAGAEAAVVTGAVVSLRHADVDTADPAATSSISALLAAAAVVAAVTTVTTAPETAIAEAVARATVVAGIAPRAQAAAVVVLPVSSFPALAERASSGGDAAEQHGLRAAPDGLIV